MPKPTYIFSVQPTGKETLTEQIMGGPIYVYGEADLRRRLKAAKEAGVKVTYRKVSPDEL
jgi:hypothetical protein